MTGEAVTLSIREPRDSEVAICRMLIPEACRESAQRCFRLAFEASGEVAGALSYRDEGTLVGTRVTCPWHGSCFALGDGALLRGPSAMPLPRYETRVKDGTVEVRAFTE